MMDGAGFGEVGGGFVNLSRRRMAKTDILLSTFLVCVD